MSDWGRVRRISTGKVIKAGKQSRGYLTVHLYATADRKSGRSVSVHQLVASAFVGPCPAGMQVNHMDTDKGNNRADNLEYLTPLGNVLHARQNGRRAIRWKGDKGHKLTVDQAAEIKRRVLAGESKESVARDFPVTVSTVKAIAAGRIWKRLAG